MSDVKLEVSGELDGMPLYKIDVSKFSCKIPPAEHHPFVWLLPYSHPEREVIEAAVKLAQANDTVDFREEWEATEEELLKAARTLIVARGEG